MVAKAKVLDSFVSDISGRSYPLSELVGFDALTDSEKETILKLHPDFDANHRISRSELNVFRILRMETLLMGGTGYLNADEVTLLRNLRFGGSISDKLDEQSWGETDNLTFSQKLSDSIAKFGGSWAFIMSFLFFMLVWITVNAYWLGNKGFDPYPFILLNLMLSCVAALQAPIIMMSQNRQEEKDRERARKDYLINLKSELEIRALHEKLDYLVLKSRTDSLEKDASQNA